MYVYTLFKYLFWEVTNTNTEIAKTNVNKVLKIVTETVQRLGGAYQQHIQGSKSKPSKETTEAAG
jgi:hypothetical protein